MTPDLDPTPAPAAHAPRHLLVVVDDDPQMHAVQVAARLAQRLAAAVTLVGIAPLVPPAMMPLDGLAPPVAVLDNQTQALADRLSQERLDEAAALLPAGLACDTVLVWGPPGPATVELAAERGADLVVVPMRRGGQLAHLLHDHADLHVLHHADVPVLVVPLPG